MLVFFVLLCFAAEGFCTGEETSIATPRKPQVCQKNEIPVKCRTICPPQSCNISYTDFLCGPETKKCESGCDCIENNLRDDHGNCIPNNKCPPPKPKCGKNQSPSNCADNYSAGPKITLCRPGCRCDEGYQRNPEDECVPKSPVLKCPKNEQPCACKQTCPPQDCSWDPKKMACKPGPCKPGCNCIEGHKRDKKGNCIPKEKCPPSPVKCKGANQVLNSCPPPCFSENCGDKEVVPKVCNTFAPHVCQARCVCRDNYRRDIYGNCIPIGECPPQCGKYEEQTGCSDNYPQLRNAKDTSVSSARIRCIPGCKCIVGYQRNSKGVCVKIPPQCGKNEEPTDCAKNIGSYDPRLIKCSPCQCIPGHVRDSNGACVPRIQCGENEELSECKKECPPDTCAWDPVLMDCKPVSCKRGCNCIKGYLRDDNGKCIPQKQCRTPQCGKYEERTDCSDNYPQLRNVEDTSVSSARIRCFPGCKCIVGYQRDSKGVCVKMIFPLLLIPRCGQNETYVPCDAGCPTQYCPENDSLAIVACSQPFTCRGDCVCKRNYKYRSYTDKRCILAKECRPIKCTRKDEEYNPCPSACFTDECGELDEETAACNTLLPPECKPRCMCRPKYRRDSSGKCIPQEKCPDQS